MCTRHMEVCKTTKDRQHATQQYLEYFYQSLFDLLQHYISSLAHSYTLLIKFPKNQASSYFSITQQINRQKNKNIIYLVEVTTDANFSFCKSYTFFFFYNSMFIFALIYISKKCCWPLRSLEPAYPNNLNLVEKEVLQCLTLTFAPVCGRCSAESCWASWGQCSQCALQRPPQAAAFFSYWYFPSCPHSLHQYSQAEWRRPLGRGRKVRVKEDNTVQEHSGALSRVI